MHCDAELFPLCSKRRDCILVGRYRGIDHFHHLRDRCSIA